MADHAQTSHQHGSMDIRQQEKTFGRFIRMTVTALAIIFAILVILALSNA
ncbi:aa3-type cytochrome c oxidase subunit IV [Rhodobacter sp. Har01]|nr:aa3-type cytochrome c oxidase subunit IV [Rhodobacter sp. Har01]MCB6177763.1 aa3-type cytochrome c oxidase subunit IV [Rhodobacter sp. Har01]